MSWNARSSLRQDPALKHKKLSFARKSAGEAAYILLQEAHGNEVLLGKSFRVLGLHYHAHSSFCLTSRGGVVTFIAKREVPDSRCINSVTFVAGRILRTTITGP